VRTPRCRDKRFALKEMLRAGSTALASVEPVPLNGQAMTTLQKQIGKHREFVFTFKGERIVQLSTAAWYKALKRAGTMVQRYAHLAADHLAPWADRLASHARGTVMAQPHRGEKEEAPSIHGTNTAQSPEEKRVAGPGAPATR